MAGSYALHVVSGSNGRPVAGSPFQVEVTPGAVCAQHCSAAMLTGQSGAGIEAGEVVEVAFDLRDAWGNKVHHLLSCK